MCRFSGHRDLCEGRKYNKEYESLRTGQALSFVQFIQPACSMLHLQELDRNNQSATNKILPELVQAFERLKTNSAALDRLQLVSEHVSKPPAALVRARQQFEQYQQQQQQQQGVKVAGQVQQEVPPMSLSQLYSAAYRAARRQLCEQLEASYVDIAEMVFTTLSSSGRGVFARLQRSFELVLIDEAAQAEEVAALQPLVYGAQCVVMVGDPQQLPATVFSKEAKEMQFERSLFERLQLVSWLGTEGMRRWE